MKRSLSLLVTVSTLALCAPLAFADSSMSSSSAMMSASSSSRMMSKCASLTGLKRAACVLQESKAKNQPEGLVRRNSHISETASSCADKSGQEKVACLRTTKQTNATMRKVMIMQKRVNAAKTPTGCDDQHGHDKAECLLKLSRTR